MFKGHPKGLIPAALANMGERFGFYTMMAILVLFLEAKFNLGGSYTGVIYSTFYALIYLLSVVGGFIADRSGKYKATIISGLLVMTTGYFLMAIPIDVTPANKTLLLVLTLFSLFTISFGNGLFKGNLQALVGQMYDNPKFEKLRDSGFSIFYMFINVGAIFAPFTAVGVRNWWLKSHGLQYNADLPALCHAYIDKTISPEAQQDLLTFASDASGKSITMDNLDAFVHNYLHIFVTGFHYAFAVAIIAMGISLLVWILNKKSFPNPRSAKQRKADAAASNEVAMDAKEVKQRLYALFAVFGVVIFFWFSFHQNGLTLTYFARDYTVLKLGSFDLSAETFQSMNPFFVVFLTPLVVALFSWMRRRGMEPSTPRKIAIGMGIAALAFLVMTLGSLNLPSFSEINPAQGGAPLDDSLKVSPFILIFTYFVLTVAELFISPLGISFVSKVSPPQYQGLMQGLWLGATAAGNQLLFIGAILYHHIPIWMTWAVFVGATSISMLTMLFMVKWLERVSK